MTKKQSTKKGSTKGKAEGSRKKARRPTVRQRARAIADGRAEGYSDETRRAVKNSLDENSPDLAELVRRAEGGDDILDVRGPFDDGGETPDTAALDYAQTAYRAALEHYYATERNPFARSRLAVVYEEPKPGDFNIVVTLPGSLRGEDVRDADLYKWLARVEMLCRTLEHPNCSDAFRGVFGAVFTDNILSDSAVSWTTPPVVRVMLPLALLEMVRHCNGDPDQTIAIFETLREQLNDDETAEEVRASVIGE